MISDENRDRLVNELLEENYDIVDIINIIWERKDEGCRTSDLEVCEALVKLMTDDEVKKVLEDIDNEDEE